MPATQLLPLKELVYLRPSRRIRKDALTETGPIPFRLALRNFASTQVLQRIGEDAAGGVECCLTDFLKDQVNLIFSIRTYLLL